MDFTLTAPEKHFQEKARRFAVNELRPAAQKLDAEISFSISHVKKAAELGFLGVYIPTKFGGAGATAVCYALMITELARECAGTTVGIAVTNLTCEAINLWGNETQKAKYLPRLTSGEAIAGAFCLSESSSGSDASHMSTTAKRDGDYYILNGEKMWITNGAHAGIMVVMAVTDKSKGSKGVSAFIVERGYKGVSVGKAEEKMGIRASITTSIALDEVRVPIENLLGNEGDGFKVAMSSLDAGRIGVAAQAIGIGFSAIELARDYAKKRTQFGKTLSDFQAIQWMLADALTEMEAARLLCLRSAWMKDRGMSFTKEASMAKVYSTEAVNRVVRNMTQIFGGYGYLNDNPIAQKFRDARVTTIYEGTSEIQRLVIARGLLRD
ncbi:MAG: acyl-CoA dehydrogenase [Myxococcota bacterium]